MAIALVGAVGATATGTNSVSPSFGQATSAGNLLVVWLTTNSTTTCTDGTWSRGTVNDTSAQVWYKANSGASETAPTWNATASFMVAALAEFSGALTVSPLDKRGETLGANPSPQTATASAADTAAEDLVLGVLRVALTKSGTDTTTNAFNNGAASNAARENDATSIDEHYRYSWGVTTGNSTADTSTATSTSMNLGSMHVAVVSFKPAAGGGGGADPMPYVGGGYYG